MPYSNCNSSNSTHNETILSSPVATSLGALILTVVFLLGFPGNFFIVWSILARARQQSITTLLILNLAIADGSLMALTPFFITYLVMMDWAMGNVMCKILFYLCTVNMYASIYLIMLMSVYRLMLVVWPQRISVITGKKTIMRVLGVVWVFVMVASIPALIYQQVRCKGKGPASVCDSFHDDNREAVLQYTLELVLGFLIPYGIISVSYICILRRIRQTKFHRIRSEKLILAIVVTFCLFWLPYHIVNIFRIAWAVFPESSAKRELFGTIWKSTRVVTSTIAFMSSCANPVLYFFAAKSYIRREGLAFMAHLFEGTGLDSSRKSRRDSHFNRNNDKGAEVVLKDIDGESSTNSSFNPKSTKTAKK